MASREDFEKDLPDDVNVVTDDIDALKINPMVIHLVTKEMKRQDKAKAQRDELGVPADPTTQVVSPQRTIRCLSFIDCSCLLCHTLYSQFRSLRPALEEESYSNEYRKRGLCLILEHDEFKPSMRLSGRRGSEVSLEKVHLIRTHLG